jgi:hypothetical protein
MPGATQLGFLLSQGSEFTLVVVGIASISGAMPGNWAGVITAAVAVTLVAAPIWTSLGLHIAKLLARSRQDHRSRCGRRGGGRACAGVRHDAGRQGWRRMRCATTTFRMSASTRIPRISSLLSPTDTMWCLATRVTSI